MCTFSKHVILNTRVLPRIKYIEECLPGCLPLRETSIESFICDVSIVVTYSWSFSFVEKETKSQTVGPWKACSQLQHEQWSQHAFPQDWPPAREKNRMSVGSAAECTRDAAECNSECTSVARNRRMIFIFHAVITWRPVQRCISVSLWISSVASLCFSAASPVGTFLCLSPWIGQSFMIVLCTHVLSVRKNPCDWVFSKASTDVQCLSMACLSPGRLKDMGAAIAELDKWFKEFNGFGYYTLLKKTSTRYQQQKQDKNDGSRGKSRGLESSDQTRALLTLSVSVAPTTWVKKQWSNRV